RMTGTRALVQTVLCIFVALPLAAQQPGSVSAPVAPKPAPPTGLAPIGIPIDRVVAIVGQKPILWSEIMDAIFYLQGAGAHIPQDSAGLMAYARDTVLSDMINQAVLNAAAKQYKSDAEFRVQLKAEGFGTETELRTSLLERRRRDLLEVMAKDSLAAHEKLAAPVNVTEADVTAA